MISRITVMAMFCIVVGMVTYAVSICDAQAPKAETMPAKSDFSRTDADKLISQRQEQIKELLSVAQRPMDEGKTTPHSAQVLAIELLGEFRAEEAVDFLVQHVTLFVPRWSTEPIPAANYPCAQALAKIGLPSVKAIVRRLESPVTEKELKLFAAIIRLIDGEDIGLLRLEYAAREATEKNKDNLAALMKVYKAKEWQY